MKSIKLAMIAVFIASTLVSMAAVDGFKAKPKKIINLTFVQAIHRPNLVAAMSAQLDPGFLKVDKQIYFVRIIDHGYLYRISGTRAQWITFFRPDLKSKKVLISTPLGTE